MGHHDFFLQYEFGLQEIVHILSGESDIKKYSRHFYIDNCM